MTPMPPSRAMATAIGASVTLSIAAETRGIDNRMSRAKVAAVSTASGSTSLYPGTMTTSSKVNASNRSKNSVCSDRGEVGEDEGLDIVGLLLAHQLDAL